MRTDKILEHRDDCLKHKTKILAKYWVTIVGGEAHSHVGNESYRMFNIPRLLLFQLGHSSQQALLFLFIFLFLALFLFVGEDGWEAVVLGIACIKDTPLRLRVVLDV